MEAGVGCDFVTALALRPHASTPPLADASSGARVEQEDLLSVIRQEVLCHFFTHEYAGSSAA
jgi:hypothetical protein